MLRDRLRAARASSTKGAIQPDVLDLLKIKGSEIQIRPYDGTLDGRRRPLCAALPAARSYSADRWNASPPIGPDWASTSR